MKKSERIDLRISQEWKDRVKLEAQKSNKSVSEYILELIKKDVNCISHEQYVEGWLAENQFINGLILNPYILEKDKQAIGKEIRKHV